MRNHRRSTITTLAFAAATMLSACNEEAAKPQEQAQESEHVTGAKFALTGAGDTTAIQFDILRVSCSGEPITPFSKTEIKQLADSGDILTDYFVLLEPGCYDVTAQPLTVDGKPSLDCSAGYIDQLVIIDGQTTEKGLQIQCEGERVGAADLWVVLNTPPVITDVSFNPDKFIPYCSDQTVCVEFKDSDGNPVDIEWHQRSGATLAAGPTPGPITYDAATKTTSQCATLRHSGPGTVGLEVIAFDKRLDSQGNLIRVEDFYASMGLSVQSRDSLTFPSHGTVGGNCPCAPVAEICDNFDNDCDGSNNEALSCVCTPFDMQYCYTGPAGTAGVGECRSGGRPCQLDGTAWDATCYEQVLPQTEICNGKDDDCDGQTDEGLNGCNPSCVVPSSQGCAYTGSPGTENVGACHAGAQICLAGGQWSACTGEVVPVPEVAGNGIDDNCNGQVDEPDCAVAGTLLAQSCDGVQLVGTYANGTCGTYTQVDNACAQQCGAQAYGTEISQSCGWPSAYDLYGTYADGNCGTFNQVISYNASTCYCQNPLPAGTPVGGVACSGYAQIQNYADGNCGTYSVTLSACSPQCAPSAGTLLNSGCGWPNTYDLYGTYADGNCGWYNQVIENNSSTCGYPLCVEGSYANFWTCSGYERIGWYYHSNCTTYPGTISTCDSLCGAPSAGTLLHQACGWPGGYDLYGTYADGNCGSYTQVIEYNNSSTCGYPGGGSSSSSSSSSSGGGSSIGPVNCWYQPDLWCSVAPSSDGQARWQYQYSSGAFGPWYTSGDTVNWGNCLQPTSGNPSFTITIEATDTAGGHYTSTVMGCQ